MKLKDGVAIVASVVAILISLVFFFKDNIFGQRILQGAVVSDGLQNHAARFHGGKLSADGSDT
jgi:hypothetical protein